MRDSGRCLKTFLLLFSTLLFGCSVVEAPGQKAASLGLIITPPSYYSTPKARSLGAKYKDNLERLVDRIVRNPVTGKLQFANNIASVGGIGFFTHSAIQSPDERFLEVVLGAPDLLETKAQFSEKVYHLFSQYGTELLGILSGDDEILRDAAVVGYGLNLSWRSVVETSAGRRITLERAIIYCDKNQVRRFLKQEVPQNELLQGAVIFAMEEEGATRLVSYLPPKPKPDFAVAMREEVLERAPVLREPEMEKAPAQPPVRPPSLMAERPQPEKEESVELALKEKARESVMEPPAKEKKVEASGASPRPETKSSVSTPPASRPLIREIPEREKSAEMDVELPPPLKPSPAQPRSEAAATAEKAKTPSVAGKPGVKAPVATPLPQLPVAELPKQEKPVEKQLEDQIALKENSVRSQAQRAPGSEEKPLQPPEEPIAELKAPAATKTPSSPQIIDLPAQAETKEKLPVPNKESSMPPVRPAPKVEVQPERLPGASKPKPSEEPSLRPLPAEPPKQQENVERAAREPVRPREKAEESTKVARAKMEEKLAPAPAAPTPEIKAAEEIRPPVLSPMVTPKAERPEQKAGEEQIALKRDAVVQPAVPQISKPEETTKRAPAIAKPQVKAPETVAPPPPPVVTVPKQEKPALKETQEQLALKRKPPEMLLEKKQLPTEPMRRVLSGFVVQISFANQQEARRWAEKLEHEGRAISLTTTGGGRSIRLRVGNFPSHDQASRELRKLEKQGLKGIVLNLPESYRPEPPVRAEKEFSEPERVSERSQLPTPSSIPERKLQQSGPFVIQLSFSDREEARRWAEQLIRDGYSTFLTATDAPPSFRLRVGDFASHEQANRQLTRFQTEGLSGLVLRVSAGD